MKESCHHNSDQKVNNIKKQYIVHQVHQNFLSILFIRNPKHTLIWAWICGFKLHVFLPFSFLAFVWRWLMVPVLSLLTWSGRAKEEMQLWVLFLCKSETRCVCTSTLPRDLNELLSQHLIAFLLTKSIYLQYSQIYLVFPIIRINNIYIFIYTIF